MLAGVDIIQILISVMNFQQAFSLKYSSFHVCSRTEICDCLILFLFILFVRKHKCHSLSMISINMDARVELEHSTEMYVLS